jgi:putative PIN family toxin of toxin-antitoxin system
MIPQVYAVLDTSVLVAGLRSKNGASFQILRAIRRGDIRIAVSVALVLEYEAVTLRPGLLPGFRPEEIIRIIDGLCRLADHQQIFFAWRPFLPDPEDDLVLELAVAASAPLVITHNTADFLGSDSMGVRAITPATALNLIRP